MWQQTKFVSHSYKNVEKIFPLKQHTVEELIEHCKAHYPSITRIVIFGSRAKLNDEAEQGIVPDEAEHRFSFRSRPSAGV